VAGDRPVATANVGWYGEGVVGFPAEANCRLIAAANPDTIRALLAERDALRVALEDELNWHETQYKVLSKQPDAYTGHNWGRWIQHQEHAVVIRAALGQGEA